MGIVKLRLTAVSDAQHGGFATGWSPVYWGSIDDLFVNLTMPLGACVWTDPESLTQRRRGGPSDAVKRLVMGGDFGREREPACRE